MLAISLVLFGVLVGVVGFYACLIMTFMNGGR